MLPEKEYPLAVVAQTAEPGGCGWVPQLSAEIFLIPLADNRYIVYAPIRQAAFVANARVVNVLADIKSGIFDGSADPDGSLIELLRRLEMVDAGIESPPVTTFGGNPEPTAVTLFLTTACNLRCTYCYASAGDTPTRFMSLDIAKRGIDFILANAIKQGAPTIEIAYHGGGEPTVHWKVMTESFEYGKAAAAERGVGITASSATNGVLNDGQIDWIIKNLAGVSLSFDGLPEAHDKHRLTIAGGGSSERVMHTLRRFDDAGYHYGLRVTVTADQISMLPDSIEFICAHFKPVRIQVEPAYNIGRWTEAPSAETQEFIDAYRGAQGRAAKFGKEITYSAARVGVLTNHFCGITQDSFALSTEGKVSACYEVFSPDNRWGQKFFYGEPEANGSGYRFNLPVLNNLRNQAVQHREFCRGCFAKWHCAGDCYHKSLTVSGDVEFSGSDRCHITREFTKDQILEKIAQSGGLFWHPLPNSDAPAPGRGSAGKEMLL